MFPLAKSCPLPLFQVVVLAVACGIYVGSGSDRGYLAAVK